MYQKGGPYHFSAKFQVFYIRLIFRLDHWLRINRSDQLCELDQPGNWKYPSQKNDSFMKNKTFWYVPHIMLMYASEDLECSVSVIYTTFMILLLFLFIYF